ncbi:uncharacterized protein Dsimw501_GD28692, isoform D [Drosophila simulans]|uniref:Uncharacterized protein, isoform D n=1 Tax=Drosophila simulans TaxID=7240 RepID=A0A0J9R513_DROSI|nr:uncharacterized protein Dsimw501_GD28692, isoform D [Drosophila simulans]
MPSRMQQCQQQGPNERRRTCRAISFSVIIPNLCDDNQQIVKSKMVIEILTTEIALIKDLSSS